MENSIGALAIQRSEIVGRTNLTTCPSETQILISFSGLILTPASPSAKSQVRKKDEQYENGCSGFDGTPGISLAAAIDPDGNRLLFDLTSTRGLSVVWMGYADGIRVFITTSAGGLSILQWFQGSWRVYVTGLTVAPKSSFTTFGVKNSTGTTNGIYVFATSTSGSLVEIVWNRDRDYQKLFVGRTIDAEFKTTQADAAIGSAYGTPDTFMRVYYLGSGVVENFATPERS
ncbi:MAG: hypothetical protein Q9184_003974 [Pyrenodesmia sp. 2 TL-2023]